MHARDACHVQSPRANDTADSSGTCGQRGYLHLTQQRSLHCPKGDTSARRGGHTENQEIESEEGKIGYPYLQQPISQSNTFQIKKQAEVGPKGIHSAPEEETKPRLVNPGAGEKIPTLERKDFINVK